MSCFKSINKSQGFTDVQEQQCTRLVLGIQHCAVFCFLDIPKYFMTILLLCLLRSPAITNVIYNLKKQTAPQYGFACLTSLQSSLWVWHASTASSLQSISMNWDCSSPKHTPWWSPIQDHWCTTVSLMTSNTNLTSIVFSIFAIQTRYWWFLFYATPDKGDKHVIRPDTLCTLLGISTPLTY